MANENEQLKYLQQQLQQIMLRQQTLHGDIAKLQAQIANIVKQQTQESATTAKPSITQDIQEKPIQQTTASQQTATQAVPPASANASLTKKKSNLESFIGQNLISKVGILLLIIGVGIGVKLAIDNNLMGPVMRIVFGYFCSVVLFGIAIHLKNKYNDFSAVLFSGGTAVAYFTTYFACIFYNFFPRELAFPIMATMTVGVVFAAIWYGREVIAHIGLWGAYAVPVLLGSGSQKTEWLYTYMLLINVGMLVMGTKRGWQFIFLNAFLSSWLIYLSGSFIKWNDGNHAMVDLLFASAFFLLFHIFSVAKNAIRKEESIGIEFILIILNAVIYFTIGYILTYRIHEKWTDAAIFTFAYASVYLATALVISFLNLKKLLFNITFSFGVFSLAIAILLKLERMEILLSFSLMILALHTLKRYTENKFFENVSIPLYIITLITAYVAWGANLADVKADWRPFIRIDMLLGLLFLLCIGISYFIQKRDKGEHTTKGIIYLTGTIFLLALYSHFLFEIISYFRMLYLASAQTVNILPDMPHSETYTIHNKIYTPIGIAYTLLYTLFFSSALGFINIISTKQKNLAHVHQYVFGLVTFLFLTVGLFTLHRLDMLYTFPSNEQYFPPVKAWIVLRYLLFIGFASVIAVQWIYIRRGYIDSGYKKALELIFHFLLLVIISHEMIHWATISHLEKMDKYGLSIFWGLYSLFLVGYGIFKNKQAYRIAGMAILGITLVKLFFYDISNLSTLLKFVLFLAIGGLMLIISFLYNKYKNVINDEPSSPNGKEDGQ